MKRMKTYITLLGASIITAGSLTACSPIGNSKDIGKDEAAQIAFDDVGIAKEDTSRFRISKDHDDRRQTYDVQFTYDNMEYEYEILASDGTILNTSAELTERTQAPAGTDSQADSSASSNPQTDNSASSNHQNASNGITWEEAAALALERVAGAAQSDLRMELEFDDGYEKYEGDIIYQQTEYEFEIDAATGKFLEWSEERD